MREDRGLSLATASRWLYLTGGGCHRDDISAATCAGVRRRQVRAVTVSREAQQEADAERASLASPALLSEEVFLAQVSMWMCTCVCLHWCVLVQEAIVRSEGWL